MDEARRARLTADDQRRVENEIMRQPLGWPLIAGTGGLRKMRFAPESSTRGKSGGVRVCYFLAVGAGRVYLMNIFSKNEKANLTPAERASVKLLITRIKANIEKGSTL